MNTTSYTQRQIGATAQGVRLVQPDPRTVETISAAGNLTIETWLPLEVLNEWAALFPDGGPDTFVVNYADTQGQQQQIAMGVWFWASDAGWIFVSPDCSTQFLISGVNGAFFDANAVTINTRNAVAHNVNDGMINSVNAAEITSATFGPFSSANVGNGVKVTAGAGWNVGQFSIASVNGTAAILNAAAGTLAATGGYLTITAAPPLLPCANADRYGACELLVGQVRPTVWIRDGLTQL